MLVGLWLEKLIDFLAVKLVVRPLIIKMSGKKYLLASDCLFAKHYAKVLPVFIGY